MAVDVEEFIRQHDLRYPTLIGHSMLAVRPKVGEKADVIEGARKLL